MSFVTQLNTSRKHPFFISIKMFTSKLISLENCYRPQTKFAKVMFLHVCVCPQGGWYPSMHCRWYPSMPCSRSPEGSAPKGVPAPGGCLPQEGVLLPGVWRTPRDGYCCGRYASYWNAFLFTILSCLKAVRSKTFKFHPV